MTGEYHRVGYRNPIPTTDVIIEYSQEGKQGIVLITRKNPPHGLAIPGGFVEYGISLENNAVKEAREETGLEVILQNPEKPFCVHSDPSRDLRGHMISATYIATGFGKLEAGDDAAHAKLYTLDEIYELIHEHKLAFDHGDILEKYLAHKAYVLSLELAAKYQSSEGNKKYKSLGLIGRFKPLHNGSAALLEAACEQAEHVLIGIGSSNRYDERNPFTYDETKAMIDAVLSKKFTNYTIVRVPDFGHIPGFEDGKEWTRYVTTQFHAIDSFVSDNPWCIQLLQSSYPILKPIDLIYPENHVNTSSTMVRQTIVAGGDYASMLPLPVATYIADNHLDERLKTEFGAVIAQQTSAKPYGTETVEEEMRRVK